VAFQCRNPIHRAPLRTVHPGALHASKLERSRRGARSTPPVDPPRTTTVSPGCALCHLRIGWPPQVAKPALRWAYLPYAMHMAGPREALQHMDIRKNTAAPTSFIRPRHGPNCKSSLSGDDFLRPLPAPRTLPETSQRNWAMETVPSLPISSIPKKRA